MGISKLKDMLAREKGIDHSKEHQKKLRKEGEKKNRKKQQEAEDEDEITEPTVDTSLNTKKNGKKEIKDAKTNGKPAKINGLPNGKKAQTEVDSSDEEEDEDEEWESDDDEEEEEDMDEETPTLLDTSRLNDSESSSSEEEDDEEEDEDELMLDDEEDVPLSEISDSDQEPDTDLIPRQRLTIDNHSALKSAHTSIALPLKSLPFSSHQSLTTADPVAISDIHDDLKRELSFYAQALDAANKARKLLHAEGVPFSRPTDYFAEMVKSEEHMGKIKDKMREEAAGKKASQEAKRQRDLKKFGKQVQVAKLQERHKEKRDTLDKIKMLKRSMFFPVLTSSFLDVRYALAWFLKKKRFANVSPSLQSELAQTSTMPTKTILLTLPLKKLQQTIVNDRRETVAVVLTLNDKRRMLNLALVERSDSQNLEMQSLVVI